MIRPRTPGRPGDGRELLREPAAELASRGRSASTRAVATIRARPVPQAGGELGRAGVADVDDGDRRCGSLGAGAARSHAIERGDDRGAVGEDVGVVPLG